MKELNINKTDFGDSDLFPVINSLVKIFDENIKEIDNVNRYKYCVRLTNELNTLLNEYNSINKRIRKYTYLLIRSDFIRRIDFSILSDNLKTHMKNLITGIINNKIKIYINV